MKAGRSIRIFLATGEVTGIRHAELVNWTGQAIVCPRTRLDELPQLINVLRSEMTLVGPRPERPFFVVKLQREIPFFRQRLFAKPGVTGLAQVKFRYAENPEDHLEKLQYDLAYIKNMNLLYDVQIILETVKVMLFRQGSR